jgi:hypothetical protein
MVHSDEGLFVLHKRSAFPRVGERQNPLLGAMMCGARPDGWAGQVVCAEIREELLAHVQLFVCEQYHAPVYTVRLAALDSAETTPL